MYAVPGPRLVAGPTHDDAPTARRGDVYDQGRARRPRGRHRATLEVTDGRGAHAVLAGDYRGPAGGGVGGIAGLWPLSPPPPPSAGRTEPPHGRDGPDSRQSRSHLCSGEGLPGTGAIPRRGGWNRVRSTPGVARVLSQGYARPHRWHTRVGGSPCWATPGITAVPAMGSPACGGHSGMR